MSPVMTQNGFTEFSATDDVIRIQASALHNWGKGSSAKWCSQIGTGSYNKQLCLCIAITGVQGGKMQHESGTVAAQTRTQKPCRGTATEHQGKQELRCRQEEPPTIAHQAHALQQTPPRKICNIRSTYDPEILDLAER